MARPFTFDRVVRLIIGVIITCGIIWLMAVLKNVLLPFFLACLLAYLLEPTVEYNQQTLGIKRRAPAVIITLIDWAMIAWLLVYFFTPTVVSEIQEMGKMIKVYSEHKNELPFLPPNITEALQSKLNLHGLIEEIDSGKLGMLLDKGETVVSVVAEFIIHSLEWALTFIYVIFILLDYNKLGKGFSLLIPSKYKDLVARIGYDIKVSMNRYFRSQLVIACCAAVFYCTGFYIIGLPMAIVMGILVGILYMIPYFQYITLIPVAIICFIYSLDGSVDFWVLLGKCGLVYLVSQSICDYVLTPKIMGKSMGLNPAIILLSLSIWGTLLGILGMIIALPMTALLLAYYKKVFIDHIPLSEPTDLDGNIMSAGEEKKALEDL